MAKKYLDGSLRSARRIFGVHIGGHATRHSRCVGHVLRGTHPNNRAAAQQALASASRECSVKG